MTQYNIVRKFYRTTRDMESGRPFKVYIHTLAPMSLRDAHTVRSKLCPPDNAIDVVVAIIAPLS